MEPSIRRVLGFVCVFGISEELIKRGARWTESTRIRFRFKTATAGHWSMDIDSDMEQLSNNRFPLGRTHFAWVIPFD